MDPKQRFHSHFLDSVADLQDQIDQLQSVAAVAGERQEAIDHILAGIAKLQNEVADAAEFTPSYDRRQYADTVKTLQDALNTTIAKVTPRSRFQFKRPKAHVDMGAPMNDPRLNRGTLSNHTSAPTTSHARRESLSNGKDYNAELASSSTLTRRPSFASASSITLTNQSSLHIVLPTSASAATSSGSLTNLRRCVIDLSVPASTSPFRGLALRDVSDSVIVVGRVDGPVHITAVSNSIIVVAARQVRIHECKDVDFYLHCSSHPIIEDCSHVRFAPLPSPYITASTAPEENQWDQVDDFKWLKAGPSPNWTTLSEAGRLSNEAWSTVQGEAGVEDILRALHIPRKKRTSSSVGSDP
ncbi:TBCC-domain-containing protein [Sarocladium strictum]